MNYKIYENVPELMEQIKQKYEKVEFNVSSKDAIYSEVIIILENESINDHLDFIRSYFQKEITNSYYVPFLLIISSRQLDLNSFDMSKTFQFKFTLENLYIYLNIKKEEKEKKKNKKE